MGSLKWGGRRRRFRWAPCAGAAEGAQHSVVSSPMEDEAEGRERVLARELDGIVIREAGIERAFNEVEL